MRSEESNTSEGEESVIIKTVQINKRNLPFNIFLISLIASSLPPESISTLASRSRI